MSDIEKKDKKGSPLSRASYVLDRKQPISSTHIGDQPFFYENVSTEVLDNEQLGEMPTSLHVVPNKGLDL